MYVGTVLLSNRKRVIQFLSKLMMSTAGTFSRYIVITVISRKFLTIMFAKHG